MTSEYQRSHQVAAEIRRNAANRITITREQMDAALKEIAVPKLREAGFKGSFPHFYRETSDGTHVVAFERGRWGLPSFYLTVVRFPADFVPHGKSEPIPPKKLRCWMMFGKNNQRLNHDPESPNPSLWDGYGKYTAEELARDVVSAMPDMERFLVHGEVTDRMRFPDQRQPDGAA